VPEAVEEVEKREEVDLGDADLRHEAGGGHDDVRRAELELLDEFVLVGADGSGVNVDGDFAAGDLLKHFLELHHAVLVRILKGRLVVRRHDLQRIGLRGKDKERRKNSYKEQQCALLHFWYPFLLVKICGKNFRESTNFKRAPGGYPPRSLC